MKTMTIEVRPPKFNKYGNPEDNNEWKKASKATKKMHSDITNAIDGADYGNIHFTDDMGIISVPKKEADYLSGVLSKEGFVVRKGKTKENGEIELFITRTSTN